ncbi:MAG: PAS domain S-box protein [bacterium]|mgnify:CR=1 FL=1
MAINMVYVFFIYGLSFFTMGMALLIYPKKNSVFSLAKHLRIIALFGILHGINEWIDMFMLIQQPVEGTLLNLIRGTILPISFFFLALFGTKVIVDTKKGHPALHALPLILFMIWAAIVSLSSRELIMGDIWARYILGGPGAFLAAYALMIQVPLFQKTKLRNVIWNLRVSAGTLLTYGFLSGLIVEKNSFFPSSLLNYSAFMDTVGIPIQVFRAACAVIIAYNITLILKIFDWETRESLLEARDSLEVRIRERTEELEESNKALKREMAERRLTEERIQESEAKYRDLFENANDLIQSVDGKGKYIYVNRKWLEVLGYTVEEVKQLNFSKIIHKDQIRHCMEIFGRLQRGETIERMETVFVTKHGEEIHVEGNLNGQVKNGEFAATRGIFRDITQRKKAEDFIKNILESVDQGFVVIDPEYRIVTANKAYCIQMKQPVEEMVGRHCYEVSHRIDRPCYENGEACTAKSVFETGESHSAVHTHHDKDGRPVYVETASYPMKDKSGKIASVIETIKDITDKRKLEEQLLQSQKMESIGRFAGGVAHDFNNILSAILGYSDLALSDLPENHPLAEALGIIKDSAVKAAALTGQILAFSRKQVLDKKAVNLNVIVENMAKMFRRMIGEDIVLELKLKSPLRNITADPNSMEQVLMNLAVNARDAMPSGGRLIIETADVMLDRDDPQYSEEIKPGAYVMLSVTDSGQGISPEIQEKIFEPFFTTKEQGKGTGLGLAMIYGIVKQHNGHISVYSKPGNGTTFKIYLPVSEEEVMEEDQDKPYKIPRGTETIMIVDDDASVRRLVVDMLEPLGYRLFGASSGAEAMQILDTFAGEIDLLLTDVIMPGMNGKELAEAFRSMHPGAKVIFMSGYTAETIDRHGVFPPGVTLVQKPLTMKKLADKIREILDQRTIRVEH